MATRTAPRSCVGNAGLQASLEARRLRAFVRREVMGGASLASLIEQDHPALDGVRAYRLLEWMPSVAMPTGLRLLRGLPGHAPLGFFSEEERSLLLLRVRRYEAKRKR